MAPHRIVDGLADIRTFRQLKQLGEPGGFREIESPLRLIVDSAASFSLALALVV
jgi:hypothetical protein